MGEPKSRIDLIRLWYSSRRVFRLQPVTGCDKIFNMLRARRPFALITLMCGIQENLKLKCRPRTRMVSTRGMVVWFTSKGGKGIGGFLF